MSGRGPVNLTPAMDRLFQCSETVEEAEDAAARSLLVMSPRFAALVAALVEQFGFTEAEAGRHVTDYGTCNCDGVLLETLIAAAAGHVVDPPGYFKSKSKFDSKTAIWRPDQIQKQWAHLLASD